MAWQGEEDDEEDDDDDDEDPEEEYDDDGADLVEGDDGGGGAAAGRCASSQWSMAFDDRLGRFRQGEFLFEFWLELLLELL